MEYIELEKAVNNFRMRADGRMSGKQFAKICLQSYVDSLKSLPTIKIVRCKDCAYGEEDDKTGWIMCENTGAGMPWDGFCSDGERRVDNG